MNNNRLQKAKNALRGVPWVLSGSTAMKLYGNKYHVLTRQPANVNIIVNKNNMANAYTTLYRLVKNRNFSPNTSRVKNKNHYNLHPYDLLKANSNLAPSIKTWINLNGIPVVSLENLLKYKTKALRNYAPEHKKGQIRANIQTLTNLIKKKGPLTVKQRNSTRTPTTNRTPRLFMNSPRTPRTPRTPQSPKKRLFNSPQ
jgi:hypothetical protein